MSFANINLGTVAGDHSGDPLRTAFDKINRNFVQVSLIDSNVVAGVYSVNARSGNVTLTIHDIPGAVTIGNVSTIVQNSLTNYANLTYVNSLIPNVQAIGTQISTAIAAEDLGSIRGQISALQSSQYIRDVDVDNLQLGNILLTNRINAGNAVVVAANTAMKSYVDAHDSSITAAWTANAGAQANQIAGANAAIITANTAMKAYVDAQAYGFIDSNTALKAYTDDQITTANAALKSYSDTKFATLINPVFPSNVSIIGNLFVNGNTTTISTNNVTINDSLIYLANDNPGNTLDIGFVGHFNDGTYQHTGLFRSASDGTWRLVSNVIPEVAGTVNITNAVYDPVQVGVISSPSITLLTNGLTGANAAIVTANTAMKAYVDAVTTAWTANAAGQADTLATLTANAGAQSDAIAAKAPTASPTFTGNVGISGNIVFADGTYQNTASSGGGGTGLGSRTSISTTVTQLGYAIGNVNITGYKGYALYSISTSANATANIWVTVYSNIAARNADYGRDSITDPLPGTGVIAEVINVGNVTQYFTPAIYGFNNETTANTNVPLKVVVNNAGTFIANVTVTLLKLEN